MSDDRFGILGKVIARTYEIRDVVAEGGFGVVYRAYHRGFRAEVALKCLKIPAELTEAQRKAFLEQFRGEAEVLFRLSAQNSNIVRPLHVDAFQTPTAPLVPFMAMEWLEGRTLDALIVQRRDNGRPPIALPKLVHLLTPVAVALEQAHNLPAADGPQIVVHRDMKPENLFLARVGNQDIPKILDFGISKVKGTAGQMAGRASQDKDLLVSFSPAYGAPEQWAPRRFGQTGRWTDVWGLALTVVEAAKGDEVIQGDHAAMMGTILDPERRPTPRNEKIDVSDQVEAVFQTALAVDPRRRFQSVGEFWDELSTALGIQQETGLVAIRHQRQSERRITTGMDSVLPPALSTPVPLQLVSRPSPPQTSLPPVASSRRLPSASTQAHSPSIRIQGPGSRAAMDFAGSGMPIAQTRSQRPITSYANYSPYPRPTVWRAISPAASMMCLSLALTLLDRAIAHSTGLPLALGPIRASWIAGACMLSALAMGAVAIRRVLDE